MKPATALLVTISVLGGFLFLWRPVGEARTPQAVAAGALDLGWIKVDNVSPARDDKVVKSDEEWRRQLGEEAYRILRGKGTEPAFCGVNLELKGEGVYHCLGCDLPLFQTGSKFDSGTGWPSFFRPVDAKTVWTKMDHKFGLVRVEVLCARCDGHLGHVFEDGPPPTGLRYCINGTVLRFVPKGGSER